jgi:hypothetical protein
MEKKSNTTLKFEKGIWVTGNTNFINEYFIGRTCTRDGLKLIALVTLLGIRTLLSWDDVHNLKQLSIIDRDMSVDKKTLPPITCSFSQKPHIYIADKLIVELLNSINKN